MRLKVRAWSVPAAAVLLAVGTQAEAAGVAAVDVTDVVTGITNQLTSIGTIGVTILGLVVAIAAYRWVKRVIK